MSEQNESVTDISLFLPISPTPDFTETFKLIAQANLELGRISQQEYDAEIQQLETKQQQLAPGGQENE